MKKTEQQHDEYNLMRKQVKDPSILYRTQMNPYNPRNSKATQNTGPNSRRIQRQYSQQSRKSQDKSCSIVVLQKTRRKEIDDSNTKASKDLSNNPSKFSTMAQLENQIQRLTTQLSIQNGELKEITKNQQKRKGQVIQLEKQVNYYEGRLDTVQNQLKNYQECFLKIGKQCDERSKYQSHVEELVSLFEGLRKQNEILNGKYEQKSYQLNKISQKYLRLKQKLRTEYSKKDENINGQQEKQSMPKKTKSSSLFKRVYESAHEQKQRQEYIRTLNSKILEIEGAISQINKQNQRLYKQLEQRDEKVNKMSKEMKNLKEGQRRPSSKSRNKLKFPEKRLIKQNDIKVDRSKLTYQQYFPKQQSSVVQQLTIKSKIQDPSSTLFRKIRYNLMCSQMKYEQFIQKLSENEICAQVFTKQPYNLKQQQAFELINWRAEVLRISIKIPIKDSKQSTTSGQSSQKQKEKEQAYKILASRIQKYKNLSLKKQHIIKITIFNTYLNREGQFIEQIMRQRYLDYYSTEEYFKYWGLNNTQVDVILKSYYQETCQIKQVDLQTISSIILRWQKL